MAFGIGSTMQFADVIVGSVKEGILDAYVDGERKPTEDEDQHGGTNNLLVSSIENRNGNTYWRAIRPLIKVDNNYDAAINDGDVRCIVAINVDSDELDEKHQSWGHFQFDFKKGHYSPYYNNYALAHAWLMIIAWIFLVPIAVLIARFYKNIGHKWFLLHRGIQIIALLLTVVGFALAVSSKVANGYEIPASFLSIRSGHQRLGLYVFLMMIINPVIGYLADKLYDPQRTSVPFWPDYLHIILGYSAVFGGFANSYTGIDLFASYDQGVKYYIILSVWIGLLIIFFIFKQISGATKYVHVKSENENENGKEIS